MRVLPMRLQVAVRLLTNTDCRRPKDENWAGISDCAVQVTRRLQCVLPRQSYSVVTARKAVECFMVSNCRIKNKDGAITSNQSDAVAVEAAARSRSSNSPPVSNPCQVIEQLCPCGFLLISYSSASHDFVDLVLCQTQPAPVRCSIPVRGGWIQRELGLV